MEHNQPIIKTQSKQTEALLLFAFSCLLCVLGPASLAPVVIRDPSDTILHNFLGLLQC